MYAFLSLSGCYQVTFDQLAIVQFGMYGVANKGKYDQKKKKMKNKIDEVGMWCNKKWEVSN